MSNLSVEETTCYRLVPQGAKKITEAEFLSRLAEKAGQDAAQARYWLENAETDIKMTFDKVDPDGASGSLVVNGVKTDPVVTVDNETPWVMWTFERDSLSLFHPPLSAVRTMSIRSSPYSSRV